MFLALAGLWLQASSAGQKDFVLEAPHWHKGDWWRVRVPVQIGHGAEKRAGGRPAEVYDSSDKFVVYRFDVVGTEIAGSRLDTAFEHETATSRSETCWVVKVAEEKQPAIDGAIYRYLYYRTKDLSLRGIMTLRKGTGKQYSEFDGPATLLCDELPLLGDWPIFPLKGGNVILRGDKGRPGYLRQEVTAGPKGLQVSLEDPTRSAIQNWERDQPWWTDAETNGRLHSRLIETSLRRLMGSEES